MVIIIITVFLEMIEARYPMKIFIDRKVYRMSYIDKYIY
jgi:hypothetical protein